MTLAVNGKICRAHMLIVESGEFAEIIPANFSIFDRKCQQVVGRIGYYEALDLAFGIYQLWVFKLAWAR